MSYIKAVLLALEMISVLLRLKREKDFDKRKAEIRQDPVNQFNAKFNADRLSVDVGAKTLPDNDTQNKRNTK